MNPQLPKTALPPFLVLVTARHPQWREGYGRLYEFDEEALWDKSILHIACECALPHGRAGYYLLTASKVTTAEQTGLVLTNAGGDRMGYLLPDQPPIASLEQAIIALLAAKEEDCAVCEVPEL